MTAEGGDKNGPVSPPVVIEKAERVEQLLQRVEQGESLPAVCDELGLEVTPERQVELQAKYEAGGVSGKP